MATFDQSLYYAVVPSEEASGWPAGHPALPAEQDQPTPPISHSAPLQSLRRSVSQRRPSATSSDSGVSARPLLPTPAVTPVKPAPTSAVASTSHTASIKATAAVPARESEPGPQPKPKRKYTKKADFWIENGGPGRRGLLATKSEGGPVAIGEPVADAGESVSDRARSTSRPTSSSGIASKISSGRKRATSSTKPALLSPSEKAAFAAFEGRENIQSPASRPALLTVAQPQSLPRTISAPALLTAEDGKVLFGSTEVPAADLAWLQPTLEPLPNTAPTTRRSSMQRYGQQTGIDDEASRERICKRLAAFEAGDEDGGVFGSPQKENARPQTARMHTTASSTSHGRSSALVPAHVAGMGRVAVAQSSLQLMAEAGARPIVERTAAGFRANGELLSSNSASSSNSRIIAPNWLDACHPWVQSEVDRRRSQTDERREVLRTVRHYLESASDDEEDCLEDEVRRAGSSDEDDDAYGSWAAQGGGKASSMLLRTNRQVRLKNSQSNPSLTAAFDASDARQALIYRTQVSSALPEYQALAFAPPHPDAIAAAAAEELGPGSIACICRDQVAEGAMVECNGCLFWFHLPCLGINEDDLGEDEWFCWRCAPAGDHLPPQMSDPQPALPHTPKTASPDLGEGSDDESTNGDDPGTPATVVLEPSPMFGPSHHATPLQRFATPLLPSATGFSHFQSPSYPRSAAAAGGHHRLPPLPLILQGGSPGPSARPWQAVLTPRVPSHTRDQEEAMFDLSSTPSRHLSRELPFGGTPISRVGVSRIGRSGSTIGTGGPRLPSFGSFATPSQEFFNGLHASPYPSTSSSTSQLPGLDHYLSSVDSTGPLSPYQPLNSRWQHHSPSIQSPHHASSSGSRPGATPTTRSRLKPGSNELRQVKEQERFGDPLEQNLRTGFSGGHS